MVQSKWAYNTRSTNILTNPLGPIGSFFARRKRKKAAAARARAEAQNQVLGMENNYNFGAGVDGEALADAGFENGAFRINARRSDNEKRILELANQGYLSNLEALNEFDPATAGDRAEQAYRDQATEDFMGQWNPMVQNFQNQIGNRFGSFNNSNFAQQFTKMNQDVLTPALARISRDAILNRGQVVQNEMNPILQALQTYNVPITQDMANVAQRIAMASQGHAQGLQTMRSSPGYQDAMRRAGWATPIEQPKGIDWGQALSSAVNAFAGMKK